MTQDEESRYVPTDQEEQNALMLDEHAAAMRKVAALMLAAARNASDGLALMAVFQADLVAGRVDLGHDAVMRRALSWACGAMKDLSGDPIACMVGLAQGAPSMAQTFEAIAAALREGSAGHGGNLADGTPLH